MTNYNDKYVPYSGICPKCGSNSLWDDNAHFGCNRCGCGWVYFNGNSILGMKEVKENDYENRGY